jgi:aryl-alcohol dehydrogenase-like predicted oxidoreductase
MRLALGTAQFGMEYGIANYSGRVNDANAKALLKLALASAVDVLDTAIAYGESETCLGNAGVGGFRVITKLPALPANCQNILKWVHEQVDASLDRLKIDHLYGLLLHHSDDLLSVNSPELYKALQSVQDRGHVHKIGVSIYSPAHLNELTELYRLDLVQAPLNIFDQRLVSTGWLRRLKDLDVEVHTRSAFLQGLLLMGEQSIPPYFSKWNTIFTKWHHYLERKNISPIEACLGFPLSFKEIDLVVVGVDDKSQLLEILSFMDRSSSFDFSEFASNDEQLINPSLWART